MHFIASKNTFIRRKDIVFLQSVITINVKRFVGDSESGSLVVNSSAKLRLPLAILDIEIVS